MFQKLNLEDNIYTGYGPKHHNKKLFSCRMSCKLNRGCRFLRVPILFGVSKRETKRKPLYFGAPIPNKRGPMCTFVSAFCAGGSRLRKHIFGLVFRLATTRACARDSGHLVLEGCATVDAQPQNHNIPRYKKVVLAPLFVGGMCVSVGLLGGTTSRKPIWHNTFFSEGRQQAPPAPI